MYWMKVVVEYDEVFGAVHAIRQVNVNGNFTVRNVRHSTAFRIAGVAFLTYEAAESEQASQLMLVKREIMTFSSPPAPVCDALRTGGRGSRKLEAIFRRWLQSEKQVPSTYVSSTETARSKDKIYNDRPMMSNRVNTSTCE